MSFPISGFLPVPLPMMIPFMGAQSLVIGKMFGEGFQYGKRKISAMPNEEFNKLTFEDMMSNAREELKASIPTMQASLHDMTPLVETIIRIFADYITEVTKVVTGTGEGPRLFEKEGEAIGEAIAHSIGTHLPGAHETTGSGIPVGPQKPFKLPPTAAPTVVPITPIVIQKFVVTGMSGSYSKYARPLQEHIDHLKKLRRSLESGNTSQILVVDIYQLSNQIHKKTGKWY